MTTGETQEATPIQVAAFRYRDKGFSLWNLSESEATPSAPLGKGWKMALFTLLLSFLIPIVGTAVWFLWYFCLRTADIKLMWTYEGKLVETKMSMVGSLMRF